MNRVKESLNILWCAIVAMFEKSGHLDFQHTGLFQRQIGSFWAFLKQKLVQFRYFTEHLIFKSVSVNY